MAVLWRNVNTLGTLALPMYKQLLFSYLTTWERGSTVFYSVTTSRAWYGRKTLKEVVANENVSSSGCEAAEWMRTDPRSCQLRLCTGLLHWLATKQSDPRPPVYSLARRRRRGHPTTRS